MTTREGSGGYQDWGQLRDHLIELYNETPHPASEQDIIDAYQLHPTRLEEAALSIAADHAAGTIRSGWGVLRKRATQITTPVANPTRSSSVDREKRINRAEQWLRNAGLHFNDESEVMLELFDTGKLLNPFAQAELVRHPDHTVALQTRGDTALIARMLGLYRDLRPLGEKIEADTIARGQADIKRRQEHPCPNPSTSPNSAPTPKKPPTTASPSSTSPPNTSSPSSTSPKPPTTTNTTSPKTPAPASSTPPKSASTKPSPEPPPNDDIPL